MSFQLVVSRPDGEVSAPASVERRPARPGSTKRRRSRVHRIARRGGRARWQRQQLQDARDVVLHADPVAQHLQQRLQTRHSAQVEQHVLALANTDLPFANPLVLLHAKQHERGGIGGHDDAIGTHQHHAVLHVVDHQPVHELLQAQFLLARQRQLLLGDLAVGKHVHHERRDHEHQPEQAGAEQVGIDLAREQGLQERIGPSPAAPTPKRQQRKRQAGQRARLDHRQQEDHRQPFAWLPK
jgi:hypothetical protein